MPRFVKNAKEETRTLDSACTEHTVYLAKDLRCFFRFFNFQRAIGDPWSAFGIGVVVRLVLIL